MASAVAKGARRCATSSRWTPSRSCWRRWWNWCRTARWRRRWRRRPSPTWASTPTSPIRPSAEDPRSPDAYRRGSRLSDFTVPELGENVAGGDVAKVLIKVGDTVRREQPVIELETDKATVEVPSSVEGVVTDIRVKTGDKVKVGAVIFTVSDNGAKAAPAPAAAAAPTAPAAGAPAPAPAAPAPEPARPESRADQKVVPMPQRPAPEPQRPAAEPPAQAASPSP